MPDAVGERRGERRPGWPRRGGPRRTGPSSRRGRGATLTWRWWSGPQTCVAGAAGERRVDRPERRREAPLRAADEAALLVGLVELERLDRAAELALPALEVLVEQAADVRERMHHQPLPDEARTSSRGRRGGASSPESSSSRGRADRVRGQHDDLRRAGSARRRRGRSRSRRSRGRSSLVSMPADAGAGDQLRAERRSPSASGSGRSTPWRPRCSPAGRCRAGRTAGGRRTAPTGSS